MKVFNSKSVAWITLVFILFQGCIAYQKQTVSIDEALNAEGKEARFIKIITKDERTLIFESIYYRDDKYFGLMVVERVPYPVETEIHPESIKEIHLYDSKKSTKRIITGSAAILVVLGLLAAIGLVAALIWFISLSWL